MKIDKISVSGFKSIKEMELELKPLNILIGANGSGKSNFIKVFRLLNSIIEKRLERFVGEEGGANSVLYFGKKVTNELKIKLQVGGATYDCCLIPAQDNLIFSEKPWWFADPPDQLFVHMTIIDKKAQQVLKKLISWSVYHFHDTSSSAKVRSEGNLNDNKFLRNDASNLAAYLYMLKEAYPLEYKNIVETIKLVAPFFADFNLSPSLINRNMIRLEWRHQYSDDYFDAYAFSDGTLRFICLAALLLQPGKNLSSTILLDEPELGLHPYAISLLAEMLKNAATKTQVIVSTQSVTLVNQFLPEDIIVTELENNQSVFKRLDAGKIQGWLENYALGDLWEKNVLGGRP